VVLNGFKLPFFDGRAPSGGNDKRLIVVTGGDGLHSVKQLAKSQRVGHRPGQSYGRSGPSAFLLHRWENSRPGDRLHDLGAREAFTLG